MKKPKFNHARRGFIKAGAAVALLATGIKPSEANYPYPYPWPGEPPREPVEGVECGNNFDSNISKKVAKEFLHAFEKARVTE